MSTAIVPLTPGRAHARSLTTYRPDSDSLAAARGVALGTAAGAVLWSTGLVTWLLYHWAASH